MAAKRLTAEELDALHDSGADMSAHLDYEQGTRPARAVQRVNVDFPTELLRLIDEEATRLGVSRQAFIKIRIADALNRVEEARLRELRDRRDEKQASFDDADRWELADIVRERFANLLRLNDDNALRAAVTDLLRGDNPFDLARLSSHRRFRTFHE